MSGYYETPDPSEDTSGGGLRKMLEQVLEENRKLRESIEGNRRQETVAGLVQGMGLDPAVAELIPENEADPKAWLDQRAHLFGVKKEASASEEQPGTEPEVVVAPTIDPAVDAAEREALERMQGAAASGSQATVTQDVLDKLQAANDPAALEELFRQGGFEGTLKGF